MDTPTVPVFPRTADQAKDMLARAHFTPERIERVHMMAYLKASDRATTQTEYDSIYCAICYALSNG